MVPQKETEVCVPEGELLSCMQEKKKSVSVTFSYIPLMPALEILSSTFFDESQFWRTPGTSLVQAIQLNQTTTAVSWVVPEKPNIRKTDVGTNLSPLELWEAAGHGFSY